VPERFYSLKKVASLLDVSEGTVRHLVTAGHLPSPLQVLGRIPRWSEKQIEAYQLALANGLLPPVSEDPVKGKTPSTGLHGATQKRKKGDPTESDENRG
jgi:predicted DNA-binding transcriptional regulator AlpA